jgi:hypothetical protein
MILQNEHNIQIQNEAHHYLLELYKIRGGQKTVEPDPLNQFGRPARSPARIYTDGYGYGYFKYPNNGFWNFGRMDTRPPDNI